MRFKKPKLPRCPDATKFRGDFRALNELLWKSRQEYIGKCAEQAKHLRGAALAKYIQRVAATMQAKGLYSQSTYVGDISWSVARWFARREVSGDMYRWFWTWLAHRGIEAAEIRGKRPGRGHRRTA